MQFSVVDAHSGAMIVDIVASETKNNSQINTTTSKTANQVNSKHTHISICCESDNLTTVN